MYGDDYNKYSLIYVFDGFFFILIMFDKIFLFLMEDLFWIRVDLWEILII